MRSIASARDLLHHVARICTPGGLVSSILTGRSASLSESDACATGLWSMRSRCWDEDVLCEVADGATAALRARLAPVVFDPGESLGCVSSYFSERFGLPAGASTSTCPS